MSSIDLPKGLPECELIQILAEKANERHDIDFQFIAELERLRKRISAEVRQINVLFPEYTPHDEEYHLTNLFHVASSFLSNEQLYRMNSAELFVLACALYGHDWGMAVSEVEKEYIIFGKLREGVGIGDLFILPQELEDFASFLRDQDIVLNELHDMGDVPIDLWREYVRKTHSIRSGDRMRQYFEPIDTGVGEATCRVCESHYLRHEDLNNPDLYPTDYPLLRESVNLRAIALYLRLIDLFDLGRDRTPYVIWKYVAPRDKRSSMEWRKHRALQHVNCPRYQDGRIVLVDGSTDDHEVYAALEDLRIYCERELRGCNDLIARMNESRHKLNIYHIHWRVAARGFEPISIQFEFDRDKVLDILGNEIYQNDTYVFLRELLQNSIDAIRMRRAVIQRKGFHPGDLGIIKVTVEHLDGGDSIITWQDDGIGMDEYIIRNYLAVVGKSYYQSPEFEREKLEMDPISRFGVGILSCFMISDRIEIETFKDPYLLPTGEPLKVVIPSIDRQFRIETRSPEDTPYGTTVRVYVNGKKIPDKNKFQADKHLNVTDYLSTIAGFVEFPIVIIEGDHKTVVLHPKEDISDARTRFGEEFVIKQVNLEFQWVKSIHPQCLSTAREVLREEKYALSSDPSLEGYEGAIIQLLPYDDNTDFGGSDFSSGITVLNNKNTDLIGEQIYWLGLWDWQSLILGTVDSRSASHIEAHRIFRDGILLSELSSSGRFSNPKWVHTRRGDHPKVYIINLPKSQTPRIDLARTLILESGVNPVDRVMDAYTHHILNLHIDKIIGLNSFERLKQLARIACYYNIAIEKLWEILPRQYWPVPILEVGGQIECLDWTSVENKILYSIPTPLLVTVGTLVNRVNDKKQEPGILRNWVGDPCILQFDRSSVSSLAMRSIREFAELPLYKSHRLNGVRFLNPPWDGEPLMLQYIWVPFDKRQVDEEVDIESVLEKASGQPSSLNEVEMEILRNEIGKALRRLHTAPYMCEFPNPYKGYLAYEDDVLNMEHHVTQDLLMVIARYLQAKRHKKYSSTQMAHFELSLGSAFKIPDRFSKFVRALKEWNRSLQELRLLASQMLLIKESEIKDINPTADDFIPGSCNFLDIRIPKSIRREFGQPVL